VDDGTPDLMTLYSLVMKGNSPKAIGIGSDIESSIEPSNMPAFHVLMAIAESEHGGVSALRQRFNKIILETTNHTDAEPSWLLTIIDLYLGCALDSIDNTDDNISKDVRGDFNSIHSQLELIDGKLLDDEESSIYTLNECLDLLQRICIELDDHDSVKNYALRVESCEDPWLVNNAAVQLASLGHYPEAKEKFIQALEIDPLAFQIRMNCAVLHYWLGRNPNEYLKGYLPTMESCHERKYSTDGPHWINSEYEGKKTTFIPFRKPIPPDLKKRFPHEPTIVDGCCLMGSYYHDNSDYRQATYWFNLALSIESNSQAIRHLLRESINM
jgi:tetratricopeptide (TPR) repeat protein